MTNYCCWQGQCKPVGGLLSTGPMRLQDGQGCELAVGYPIPPLVVDERSSLQGSTFET